MIAIDIANNPIDLHPATTMFDPNPFTRNGLVVGPFVCRQGAVARFLLRLTGRDALRFIALKAGIFEQRAARRKVIVFIVGCTFIVCCPRTGTAQPLDLFGALLADNDVLEGMSFLLAALIVLLSRSIWALDRPFCPIDDELQRWTRFQHLSQRTGLARWQWLRCPACPIQGVRQQMNPDIRLGVTHAKQEALDLLGRIKREVKPDEQQWVDRCQKRWMAPRSQLPPVGSCSLRFPFMEQCGVGLGKGWGQRAKGNRGQPRKVLEDAWLLDQRSIGDHQPSPSAMVLF